MRIFLAGIMQGSFREMELHSQEYRTRLKEMLKKYVPDSAVYDPFEKHTGSVNYSDELGKKVFLGHNYLCREMDVILAFIPEASMGTAVEIWEGNQHGAVVVSVSPLKKNWAVKFLSHVIYATLEELEEDIHSGRFVERVAEIRQKIGPKSDFGQNFGVPH
ncbi:MAG: hypothetical protein IJF17_10400 [Thermoguttaceae bacterium]|nr:hypothetical protein [Thermoguttaceae bacterium]